jgi:hypothetical protein
MDSPSEALPLAHFIFTSWTSGQFLSAVFAALLGIWGINNMVPKDAHKKRLFWVLFAIAIGLSAWTTYENAKQLQSADLDKRTAEKTNEKISHQYDEINGQLAKLASAANIKAGQSPSEIINEAISLLPKATAVDVTSSTGNLVRADIRGDCNQIANGDHNEQKLDCSKHYHGASPAKLAYREKLISQVGDKKIMELHISTDRTIKAPTIGFTLSAPINESDEYWRTHAPMLGGFPAPIYNWGKVHNAGSAINVPNSFGVMLGMPSNFGPGSDLVITVETDINSHVLSVVELR